MVCIAFSNQWSVCMSLSFCINGVFLKPEEAVVPAMDRGFLFGDGIYEVMAVIGGKLIEFERHFARMERSLAEIAIPSPYTRASFLEQCRQLMRHSQLDEGYLYVQITRGVDAVRDFAFPQQIRPTTMLFTRHKDLRNNPLADSGMSMVSVPDLRWARRDIKSVSLLAQVLAKQEAQQRGANEAVMVDAAGMVTEGASSSILLVDEHGNLVVKPLSHAILPGCTRAADSFHSNRDRVNKRFTCHWNSASDSSSAAPIASAPSPAHAVASDDPSTV